LLDNYIDFENALVDNCDPINTVKEMI
jgi:hypothetical protein